jgi:hypothetical protein
MTKDSRCPRPERERGPIRTAGARWIVCEQSGRWAIGLRREAGAAGMRLYETRTLADAWSMLEQFPSSFLVAELTLANVQSLLDRMGGVRRAYPLARIAVVADRSLADYEWLAREAGAIWFATSPRELRPIVAIAERHVRLAPAPPGDFVQEIWDALPWKPVEDG